MVPVRHRVTDPSNVRAVRRHAAFACLRASTGGGPRADSWRRTAATTALHLLHQGTVVLCLLHWWLKSMDAPTSCTPREQHGETDAGYNDSFEPLVGLPATCQPLPTQSPPIRGAAGREQKQAGILMPGIHQVGHNGCGLYNMATARSHLLSTSASLLASADV
jgi:hypothetical protein